MLSQRGGFYKVMEWDWVVSRVSRRASVGGRRAKVAALQRGLDNNARAEEPALRCGGERGLAANLRAEGPP